MLRAEQTLNKILRTIHNTEKEAIVTRKKTGWFDKERMLNRISANIGRMRNLGVDEKKKQAALVRAFRVYLNVQGMNDKNEIRDERRVPLKEVLDYTINKFDTPQVDNPSPEVYSHGRGYAVVNWKYIYATKEKAHLGGFWNPGSGKRDKHGRLLLLEDSDYWVFRDDKKR